MECVSCKADISRKTYVNHLVLGTLCVSCFFLELDKEIDISPDYN